MEDERSTLGDSGDLSKYQDLTYDDFRRLASDPSLTETERVGAPDEVRAGKEQRILESIVQAVGLDRDGLTVVDIGCGCGRLAFEMLSYCESHNHSLVLSDSEEVLSVLPSPRHVSKIPGRFPESVRHFEALSSSCDVVIAYSVLHYVFREASLFDFVDACLTLLAPSGILMLGDVPNSSKRKRFLSTERGREFHRAYMKTLCDPVVEFNRIERHSMDDAVILSILSRSRLAGFDAYVKPQPDDLPYANRREDILIKRP